MATLADVLNFARAQVQTDSNGLTDPNGIVFANEALVDFHRRLVNAGVDASSIQEAYRDGVVPTTAGNGSTFLYPTDMLFLKAIEVNYSNTNAQNYITALQYDASNIPGQQSFSWMRVNGSKMNPMFDDHGDWYEIAPSFSAGDNISQAIRILYFQKPSEYNATSNTISYPESQDYRILGWKVAASYLYSLLKIPEGDKFEAKYLDRVKNYISTLSRGSQQPIQATAIPWTGFEF